MTVSIRHERPADAAAIESVTIAAFAGAPHSRHTESHIVRALRAAHQLTLSLVAQEPGQIIGHLAASPVTIAQHRGGWHGLGPISVLPARQRQGIGSRLMERALSELRARGAGGCVVLGDPAYYARFGFKHEPALQYPGAPPEYFMALTLQGPTPAGIVQYSDAFGATA